MAESWVKIGQIRSVNPGRREVRIAIAPGRAHEFADMTWLRVATAPGKPLRCRLETLREGPGGLLIAAFAAGVLKESVAAMRGAPVVLAPEEATLPPDDDLRAENLPGLCVRDEAGVVLGEVVEAYASRAHPVVCIERPEGGRFLLPVIDEVVVAADFGAGVLDVTDIGPYITEAPD